MTPAAVEALAFVEWAGPSTYVTARGKSKDIVTGTPSPTALRPTVLLIVTRPSVRRSKVGKC